jgi:hypothetical protein
LVERDFAPKPPHPRHYSAWKIAAALAEEFWSRAANDNWIGREFRAMASQNREVVAELRERFD